MKLKTFLALQIPRVHNIMSVSSINLLKQVAAQAPMLVKAVIILQAATTLNNLILLAATTLRAHYLLRVHHQSTLKAHMGAIHLIRVHA
jgi:hypothetical protein